MEILETPTDCCYVCYKHFKPYRLHKKNDDYGMIEVDIITAHTGCRKLIRKRNKLTNEILEIDYDIFMKQIVD